MNKQISLSKILRRMNDFICRYGQLYDMKLASELEGVNTSDRLFDICLNTPEDYCHFFLYVIYELTGGTLAGVNVIDDTDENAEWPIVFPKEMYNEVITLSSEWGVSPLAGQTIAPVRTLMLVSTEGFRSWLNSPSSTKSEQVTDVFVLEPHYTQEHLDAIAVLSELVDKTVCLWNASVELIRATYQNDQSDLRSECKITLNGETLIKAKGQDVRILLIMCYDGYDNLASIYYRELYTWLLTEIEVKQKDGLSPVILLDSMSTVIHKDFSLLDNFFFTGHPTFSRPSARLITLMAYLHMTTGVQVEFTGFSISAEQNYLDAVSRLMTMPTMALEQRIASYRHIEQGKLYFVSHMGMTLPAVLCNKNAHLAVQAYTFDRICRWICKSSVVNYRWSAYLDIDDLPEPDVKISSVEELSDLNVYSFRDMLSTIADVSIQSSDNSNMIPFPTYKRVEDFIYNILRVLEQKLFHEDRVLNLADLIMFERDGVLYLGAGDFASSYTVDAYCYASGWCNLHKTVASVLPATILYNDDWDTEVWQELPCKNVQHSAPHLAGNAQDWLVYICMPDAVSPNDYIGYEAKYNEKVFDVVDILLINFYHDRNSVVRLLYTEDINRYFTSFGLACVDVCTSPLNIYGGFNFDAFTGGVINFYPITFKRRPREAIL